jgi:transposase-like protein/DNA-directed RNA polymerase subunit RPC12/RpoP
MIILENLEKLREERGLEIVHKESQVKQVEENFYTVLSQSGNGEYAVFKVDKEWTCECPDNRFRQVKCKHIFAVETSIKIKEQVKKNIIIAPLNTSKCVYCGSEQIVKDAVRHNKKYDIQRYLCKTCGKRFSVNIGFEGMKASPQVITSAMQLYFTGESLRNVQKFLKLQGISVSHVSVLKWIRKYVKLMNDYLEKIKPNVSDTWRADELYVKIKGDMKYLFAIMDDETRFWIAQEISDSKYAHDARTLFQAGVKVAGKKPMTIITDGLPAYHDAYKKEFWTQKNPRTKHISAIRFRGDHNNNKMERMNGEVRDREEVMRGLKKVDTPILKGYQLFHNYIRSHEGLDGKTPAEACGIKVKGENKWKTLIENASKKS